MLLNEIFHNKSPYCKSWQGIIRAKLLKNSLTTKKVKKFTTPISSFPAKY